MGSYDYVIVGAGSAGCVLANRLSADPGVRVLLLEAGGSDRKMNIRIPVGFAKQFRTDLDWNYTSEPEPNLIGRSVYLPRGRSLGGSSSMNAMIYLRGHRSDYDGWAESGAPGWSYRDVLPYFKRSEGNERLGAPYHGQDGPLNVADPKWRSVLSPRFFDAATAMGVQRNDDVNGESQDGVGYLQLNQKRGRRWSASDAFLHPAEGRPNLTVATASHATRVVIDGGRAVGVEYECDGVVTSARADREVVVSAGAYNSPQLLMLSGVGPADHLRSLGIEPAVDSPHVGRHLQDHPMTTTTFACREPKTLFDATHPRYLLEYLIGQGRGKLSSNVAEAAAHVRIQDGVPGPDFQVLFGVAYYFDHGFRTYPGHAFTIAASFLRPRSEGEVRLRSANPHDPPAITNNFLDAPEDLRAMIDAVRFSREIVESGPLADVVERNIDPGPGVREDDLIEAWVRAEMQHTYHPACTCRMGAEGDGVLDDKLRVRGVEGLRVADTSVMPRITAGNTNAPAIMIAERAADFMLGHEPLAPEDPAEQGAAPVAV